MLSEWWFYYRLFIHSDGLKIMVNNRHVWQIITMCFRLGHKTNLSDHMYNIAQHKEMSIVFPL